MIRFPCQSQLNITCRSPAQGDQRIIRVSFRHAKAHLPYENVAMPEGALAIIQQDLEHSTPSALVTKIQDLFPNVSAPQIYTAWAQMSEMLWKRNTDQLTSAKLLLKEFPEDIDLFEDLKPPEGVEQFCFALKQVVNALHGKVVEIGLDATCKVSDIVIVQLAYPFQIIPIQRTLSFIQYWENTTMQASLWSAAFLLQHRQLKLASGRKHYMAGVKHYRTSMASFQSSSTLTKTWLKSE